MDTTLGDITFSQDKEKQETFKAFISKIGNEIVIPEITLSHLNTLIVPKLVLQNYSNTKHGNEKSVGRLDKTPAALHYVIYNNRKIPIIIFSYGFIYLGKDDSFILKKDEWKMIWFEHITGATSEKNKVTLIGNISEKNPKKQFNFTSCEGYNFNNFINTLKAAFKVYSQISFIPNKVIVLDYIAMQHTEGGRRRKTKRSNHITRNKRNKKCKRHTRRS